VNLTGVRLIDPESSIVRRTLQSRSLNWNLIDGSHLRVEAALAYDAVQFSQAVTRVYATASRKITKNSLATTKIRRHGFSL